MSWSMAAMLCNVLIAVAAVVAVHMCLSAQAMPLAIFIMRKVIHGFL